MSRAVEHRRPQLITVIGEAGIGKSRLAEEVVIELQHQPEPPAVWIGRCLPYGEGGPYAPLAEVLLRSADVANDAPREEARLQAEGHLRALLGEDADREISDVLRTAGLGDGDEPADDDLDGRRPRPRRLAAHADGAGRAAAGAGGAGGRALGRGGAARPGRVAGHR